MIDIEKERIDFVKAKAAFPHLSKEDQKFFIKTFEKAA